MARSAGVGSRIDNPHGRHENSLETETRKWEPLSSAAISGPLDEVTGRRSESASHTFIARGAVTRHEKLLSKLAPVPFVLRFHLRHKLDEIRRLSNAVQIGVSLEQGVTPKTRGGSLP